MILLVRTRNYTGQGAQATYQQRLVFHHLAHHHAAAFTRLPKVGPAAILGATITTTTMITTTITTTTITIARGKYEDCCIGWVRP
jgi:hypothetical protein